MELNQIALIVDDYDKAIDFYCHLLGFHLLEDTKLSEEKRWVVLSAGSTNILLAKAKNEVENKSIGNQSGGRVFLFAYTDNFDQEYLMLKKRGVVFMEEPRMESYGKVVVFKDIYGNLWDLIEKSKF